MTPEQIEELARQIVSQGLPINWKVYVVMGLLTLTGAAIGAAIAGYYSKRGEIKAIHDQINKVEDQTRRITNVVEREKSLAWIDQKRWDLKREIYTGLIHSLDRLIGIHSTMIHVLASNNPIPPELNAEFMTVTKNIFPIISLTKVFLSIDTLQAFHAWAEEINKSRTLIEQKGPTPADIPYSERAPIIETLQASTNRLLDLVIESAKRDLILS